MNPTNSPPFKRFAYYWLPVLLYCLLIFIQSSFPASEHVPEFDFSDKLLHVGAYAVLGFLLYRAFSAMDNGATAARFIAMSIFLTALYGASDEIHQYFVPSRSAEFLDFAADAIGGILGVMTAMIIYKNR
ncbi:MAG: VanZ family protein [Deltaproteobacteria bacterium]